MAPTRALALTLSVILAPVAAQTRADASPGESAEDYLRSAKVRHLATLEVGVTRSQRAVLDHDGVERRATWKTIDEFAPMKDFHDSRPPEIGFRDSYRSEIAAYELAKLLGLDLVPPTVERRIRGESGSLQLWIEGAVTYGDWLRDTDRGLRVAPSWHDQVATVRLLRQLTHDMDYPNVSNVLVDGEEKVWAIDFSRAFRTQARILAEDELRRFSRSLLQRLRTLDAALVEQRLGRWLTGRQQESLLARRDLIVALAERRIAALGEEAVLFD